jgi:hypothetical protein
MYKNVLIKMIELKRDKTVRCNYTIPEGIVKKLHTFSKENKISKSNLISHLLDKFFQEDKK